jgi:hypothetical protein
MSGTIDFGNGVDWSASVLANIGELVKLAKSPF